ncbi:MAG: hypothetical protein PHT02_13110, partial [Tissierellia bacterium]|nr:hypothetical protein [Tissierellia bacterium]
LRGNTLVIPIENSLLYVEPIYLKSDTESNFPEMKMVVVSFADKIVMENSLDKALERLFGKSETSGKEKEENIPNDNINNTLNDLILKANELYTEANEATKNGDWAKYGESLKRLEEVLNQLNFIVNGVNDNAMLDNNTDMDTIQESYQ